MRAFAIVLFLIPLFFAGALQSANAASPPPGKSDPQQTLPPSLAPMLAKVSPAVVNISVTGTKRIQNPLLQNPLFRQFFNAPNGTSSVERFEAVGSGIIYNAKRGYIVTNNHVIAHASQIMVTLHDHRQVKARLVATDPKTDIAVLQIKAKHLPSLPLGNSNDLRVGDYVVAIGDPFAVGQTATFGIVSALGRTGLGIEGYEDFIQTDASINPGNSGGALVNMKGQVIGMNTAILSRSGGNVGIGFAIPINMIKNIAGQLIAHGKVSRGELGVIVQNLTPALADAMNISTISGALIADVLPGSAAAKAGLKPQDVVIALNGRSIGNSAQLRNHIAETTPGTVVHLAILRDGSKRNVAVKLMPLRPSAQSASGASSAGAGPLFGLQLSPIPQSSPQAGMVQGAYVSGVVPGSVAFDAGIRSGDIITQIDHHKVDGSAQATALLRKHRKDSKPVLLRLRRGPQSLYVALQ